LGVTQLGIFPQIANQNYFIQTCHTGISLHLPFDENLYCKRSLSKAQLLKRQL
jgi:hypothetical protein